MARVTNFKQTVDWISRKVDFCSREWRSPTEAALWFFAYREANTGYFSDLSTKDFARLLITGIPAISQESIDEDLADEKIDAPDVGLFGSTYDLTPELEEFWF